MFKKIFGNTYVKPFTTLLLLPIFVLVGPLVGFVVGLREAAEATFYACDELLK